MNMSSSNKSAGIHSTLFERRAERYGKQSARTYSVFAAGLMIALWLNAPEELAPFNQLLGFVMGAMILAPWYFWLRTNQRSIPFLELLSIHYFLIFCTPVFFGPVEFFGARRKIIIAEDDLTRVLLVSILGLLCLFVGHYIIRSSGQKRLPQFHIETERTIKLCLIYLGISSMGPLLIPMLPGLLGKVGDLVFRVNGSVATFALAVYLYSGRLNPVQRLVYVAELGLFLVVSLGTGWLSAIAYPVISFFLGEITAKKQVPWLKIFLAVVMIVALNSVKDQFRKDIWKGEIGGPPPIDLKDSISRASHWIYLTPVNGGALRAGVQETVSRRANHLGFFGHVIHMTPEKIPYLNGSSYMDIPAMLVPRLLWRDKPSTMDIPNFLALRYGWLSERLVGSVAFSPGLMDEAYMNFGIPGVIFVMLAFGFLVGWMTNRLGNEANGLGWQLVLVGFIAGGGLMITWPAGSYLGGLWQTVVAITLLYWVVRIRKTKGQRY